MRTVKGLENGQRAALLISECQNGITNSQYSQSPLIQQVEEREIVTNINQLAAQFRQRNLPVVHCTISAPPDFKGFVVNCVLAAQIKREKKLVKGSRFAAIHDDIYVHDGDIISDRMHGMSPFSGTELDSVLKGLGVETIVLAGVSTNVALPGAATEAVARYYNVVLAEDCVAGGTAETHHMQISMHLPLLATIADSESILAALGK
jgi:nicotinamidase-related amidase